MVHGPLFRGAVRLHALFLNSSRMQFRSNFHLSLRRKRIQCKLGNGFIYYDYQNEEMTKMIKKLVYTLKPRLKVRTLLVTTCWTAILDARLNIPISFYWNASLDAQLNIPTLLANICWTAILETRLNKKILFQHRWPRFVVQSNRR